MSVPAGRRTKSKEEFDAQQYRIHDDAEDMIENKFHAKKDTAMLYADYIDGATKALRASVWKMIEHIKIANALYPTTHEELVERRLHQDKAIGLCANMTTLYEIVMRRLKVPDDYGVNEIKNIETQMNSIKNWRSSDNKRFKHLQ